MPYPEQTAPAPVPAGRLHVPVPPADLPPGEERVRRKERLAAGLRLFGRSGYDDGVTGHLTARDPEFTDCFWVNPFGLPIRYTTVDDLVLVDHGCRVVEGGRRVNEAEVTLLAEVHRSRPHTVSVAHCHSRHGRTLSALGELLEPLTQDACAFYEDHALLDVYTGVTVDAAQGRRVADALGPHKGLILRNHGLLTAGDSVDAAAWWFHQMETACGIQLAARAAGRPVPVPRKDALETRERIGSDLVAWMSYQPMHAGITREEPDLMSR